ncbi:hypothetical protein [Arthrobacter sp. UYCu712]|uniref:hypothetical protein n=1 Tax=Arthrobacter sp. UYCu712 TaxID=3156340 RepID=UPI0033997E98
MYDQKLMVVHPFLPTGGLSRRILHFVDANILGVVQNRIPRRGPDANTAYVAGYGAKHPENIPPVKQHDDDDDGPFRPAHVRRGKFVSVETS